MADPVEIKLTIPVGIDAGAALLSDEMGAALKNSALSVEAEAKKLAPKFQGTLKRSITSTVVPLAGNPTGIVSAPIKYAKAIEFGGPPRTPPIQALQPWADKKGIPVGALWVQIRRYGTKAQPFMSKAFEAKKQAAIERVNLALQKVTERMRGR